MSWFGFRSWVATYLFSSILYLPPKQSRLSSGQSKQALLIPSLLSWYSPTTQTLPSNSSSHSMSSLQLKMVIPLHLYFIYSLSFIQLPTSLSGMPVFPNRLLAGWVEDGIYSIYSPPMFISLFRTALGSKDTLIKYGMTCLTINHTSSMT